MDVTIIYYIIYCYINAHVQIWVWATRYKILYEIVKCQLAVSWLLEDQRLKVRGYLKVFQYYGGFKRRLQLFATIFGLSKFDHYLVMSDFESATNCEHYQTEKCCWNQPHRSFDGTFKVNDFCYNYRVFPGIFFSALGM